MRRARPDGLDPRDVAWMWRRLLVALGLAHRAGVVHGAVLPDHVLIEPADHGVVLVDWCYSVTDRLDHGARRSCRPTPDWYPREVHKRQPPGPGTDIAMAARCMTALMGRHAPTRAAHLRRRLLAAVAAASGPTTPGGCSRELDDVLERLYGPRNVPPASHL